MPVWRDKPAKNIQNHGAPIMQRYRECGYLGAIPGPGPVACALPQDWLQLITKYTGAQRKYARLAGQTCEKHPNITVPRSCRGIESLDTWAQPAGPGPVEFALPQGWLRLITRYKAAQSTLRTRGGSRGD